jgi:hypothetical protein
LADFADHPRNPLQQTAQDKAKGRKARPAAKNAPQFDLSSELERITGVDLTRIDGIDVMGSQTIISEIGLDMGKWKTEGGAALLDFLIFMKFRASALVRRRLRPPFFLDDFQSAATTWLG